MYRLLRIVALASACAFAAGAGQQERKPAPPQAADRAQSAKTHINLQVTRVNIVFTVTDRGGRFISGLTQSDFEVTEDKQPQTILGFGAENDVPLRVAVLVDTSNSVRDRFRFIQEAAIEFIGSAVRPGRDKVMLVSFDTVVALVCDLTDDVGKLAAAVRDLRPGGGTSLYDAIQFASPARFTLPGPPGEARRAVVILSDGDDTESHSTRDQALESSQQTDAVIYAISTNPGRTETMGDKVLRYLAEQTGGSAFFPFKIEDLARSFTKTADELRHQYVIYYRPEPLKTDGQFHTISLRVKGRKNLVVHARKGYYAPVK